MFNHTHHVTASLKNMQPSRKLYPIILGIFAILVAGAFAASYLYTPKAPTSKESIELPTGALGKPAENNNQRIEYP
jgi:hypothetical protein